jgi:CRP/FNR family cyclic AMP-dependent transcriptional regulator
MSTEIRLSDEAHHLSLIPLFKDLDAAELEKLADMVTQVQFKQGEVIFHQNDAGDALYAVESGAVRIWVRDEDVKEVTLSELKPGDFFGELAVLDSGERSATATATEDTVLHRLLRDDCHKFLLEHPACALDVVRAITGRMRETNRLVSERAARNVMAEMDENATIGMRIADKVAAFGGSWTFIIIYSSVLVIWMAVNVVVLKRMGGGPDGAQFDPYPFILLNLALSMTAAMQAPIIMMSQNRAASKDRAAAEQDFKVNLKSELMLEELLRRDKERAQQLDSLVSHHVPAADGAAAGAD